MQKLTLPITVDKSHLIAIGEQLYIRSVELIRELVNNAYDADATEVRASISKDRVEVADNGTGMDMDGLKQYFNIGSPEKRLHNKSKKYHRERIGQFGIGKFSALTAGTLFEVRTQCGDFAATVTFDKDEWERYPDKWELPMTVYPADPSRGDGTTVAISKLKKELSLSDVEKCIVESVPIKAPHFNVILNDKRIMPREFAGQRIPFMDGTEFGPIHGEIYILPESRATAEDMGIMCLVKQVMVKREFFGMETWGADMARVRGEVHANFLPITSDRSGFIIDSNEYKIFYEKMAEVIKDVRRILGSLSDKKETQRVKRALKDALHRVQMALSKNPEFSPFGIIPLASEGKMPGEAGMVMEKRVGMEAETGKINQEKETEVTGEKKEKKEKKPSVKKLTPGAVVQKMKLGNSGVSCCIDHFGDDAPEVFTEGTIIYINRDHPLYKREEKKTDTHTMHIARLMTQEISLMKDPANPRQAYERQSKLLKDAFINNEG
ncbi:MAG: hypothetical protein A3I04_02335 [Nitrospinae bacterium RIFCSPLOWO2_02_FULL_39_110]|nr:MAG: hypothetical protein A2W53_00485 [Nitrospinae bacterium RIFCSPHIGHO2_02_39_11]OGV98270.1 MAG: hypothetical protein A3D97_07620 [Nitrospinae bacterium RIFCSPHIGHO2_12_FULL_39_42]OGW00031.1 MAG: hypothetical protein A3D20_03845 [Nitrospinae bacterium RIFCSPHIGHO2_02_FULL_39_82]OGW07237.1 MAG: hypothetical protein A3I04_02335 [Nitrospinae bacterium RIFCSPLOWO2_02_FULL_39_110]OGW07337.1 MAG: hypothetical protein A2Z59_05510 [Nitrospinae bacterium RIFCSPLOWO2_02_39_17]OGW11321.1 MAG: hypoth